MFHDIDPNLVSTKNLRYSLDTWKPTFLIGECFQKIIYIYIYIYIYIKGSNHQKWKVKQVKITNYIY
jgi:hypothetical protein